MFSQSIPKNIARFILRCLTASVLLLILLTAILLGPPSSLGQTNKGISKTSSETAPGDPRTALVIGNAKYTSAPLRNPVNDARAISSTLQELGFQVTLLEDASQKQMKRAIDRFGEQLRDGGVGLFYYSGHGIQVSGRNYLVPLKAEIASEQDVEYESVDAGRVLAKMDAARNGMNLVILDACRNNPYARSFRSDSQGLATLNAPSGTFIAYATAPGSVASDGTGRNGLYTGELVRHMNTPGLKLEEVFKRVRADVQEKSDNAQVPWDASSLTGDFFFVPPQEQLEQQVATAALPQPSSSEAPKTIRADESAWKDIENSEDPEDFRFFLEEFPESLLAKTARFKLKRLARKQAKDQAEQQQLAEEAKQLEEERKQLEAEKKQLAETQRKVEEEQKKQQELAALRPKRFLYNNNETYYEFAVRRWSEGDRIVGELEFESFEKYLNAFFDQQNIDEKSRMEMLGFRNQQVTTALRPKQESTPSGAVIDQATGLMWQKEAFDYHLNWYGAVEYCKNLDLGGFNDWTLPEKGDYPDEKSKILKGEDRIHDGRYEQFWTLTEAMSFDAWTADFSEMNPDVFETKDKLKEYSARCVRGEKKILAFIPSKPESTEAQPETVIDQATGLMWQKEAFDYHFNWYGAVEYCKNLDLGGFNDWTLPEKGDYPDEKSKILKGEDRIHDGRYEQFWTLTEAMGFGAWTADFSEMNPDVYETKDKLKEYSVRCVRGEKKILAFIPSKPESTEAQPETVIDQATGSWIEPVTGMKFLRIPGGTFMMGSPFSEKDRDGNETQHTMSVGKFLLAETEVTQAQWKTVMGSNPASFKGNNLPVENMSWNDAQKFIQKFNARTGKKFRLPTEAEWEYAARAGTTTAHYWGEGIGRNNANCSGCGSRWDRKQTAPVKSFAHNAFGLFDMLGNVYEWTCSEYKEYYDGNETKCTNQAGRYSLRGGSWSHLPKRVRASSRGRYFPSNSSSYGFRLAMDAP